MRLVTQDELNREKAYRELVAYIKNEYYDALDKVAHGTHCEFREGRYAGLDDVMDKIQDLGLTSPC